MQRRDLLAMAARSGQYLIAGAFLGACGRAAFSASAAFDAPAARRAGPVSHLANVGPLGEPDANGVRLPAGFRARIVAVSGEDPTGSGRYRWHAAPDGGATFAAPDGGWIYVSNSEVNGGGGGVGALRFDPAGNVADAYPILRGTSRNCAGGPTPWNTWLSCEEIERGRVWECDPAGRRAATVHPALGCFRHEAVAVDPASAQLYLTEDEPDGRWYRFTPARRAADGRADLSAGTLEVAWYRDGVVTWLPVDDPAATNVPTRHQIPDSTVFNGAEGITYHDGFVYFATKLDQRVWAYEITTSRLTVVYDAATAPVPVLRGVDNLEVGRDGDILVAEDGDDMQIVALTPDGAAVPLVQVTGHFGSEITGPAFDPSFRRLYFSSQRGAFGLGTPGITYELTGPFTLRV